MGMKLIPWSSGFSAHHGLFFALRKFSAELRQALGTFNFYLALFACLYLTLLRSKNRQALRNGYYIALFGALIILPFLAIAGGSVFFKEVDTLQYLMPSYPLLGLITAYALGRTKYNLGLFAVFFANIGLWLFMSLFMLAKAFGIGLDMKFPDPLTLGQEDTEYNSMFYPQKPYFYGAKEIRNYFKTLLKDEKAALYGFLVPKAVLHRSYFDELLMHGIIQPGAWGHLENPCYTDRKKKEESRNTIFIILTYKYTQDAARITLDNTDIFVDPKEYPYVLSLLASYKCKIIKEFYLPGSTKKIMTVIKGDRPTVESLSR
jgi:hypothetical protein